MRKNRRGGRLLSKSATTPAYEDDDDPVTDDDTGDSGWTYDGDDWPLSPELPAPPSD